MNSLELEMHYGDMVQPVYNNVYDDKKLFINVLRLDNIHAIISGNKWFKLNHLIHKALEEDAKTIITTGGPYSNHLIATAYACKKLGLHSVGIIKSYYPLCKTPTIQDCILLGMEIVYMQPSYFNNTLTLKKKIAQYTNSFWINIGGYSKDAAEGCKQILSLTNIHSYTHIITAVGTGTTLAGLCLAASKQQKIIGVSSMKGNATLQHDIERLLIHKPHAPFELIHDFHFGGFAKYNSTLINFMNTLYQQYHIPTDIVYTGKVFYAVNELIEKNYFPQHSKLLIIHTGGLQGNRSLPISTLVF